MIRDPSCLRLLPRALALACALAPLAACTTVQIYQADGQVAVERHWGTLNLALHSGTEPLVVTSSVLGLQSGPAGQALGFSHSRLALLPQRCQVVILLDAPEAARRAAVQDLLSKNVCGADTTQPGEK